jgi:HlyD family secretion protein
VKKWIILVLLPVLGAGGYYYWGSGGDTVPQFRIKKIDTGIVVATVSATGAVEPLTLVQVGSQISGTIKKIYVDFNDRVKAGQIICELDQTALKAQVSQDRANLVKAKANVRRVRAKLLVAEHDLKRSKKLASDSLISGSELERAVSEYGALAAEVEVARAEVKQKESALDRSLTNLGYATIRSPIDGVVISRDVDVGQTVAASLQAPVLFGIAESLDRMHVKAAVGEADIGLIMPDQSVRFSVDAFPDDRFSGTVLQIRLSPTVEQNVVTYTVIVSADNPEGKLLPGMTANLDFEVGRSPETALRVSNLALRFEPDSAWLPDGFKKEIGKKPKDRTSRRLWILENGELKPAPVRIGLTDGIYTQIIDGDIREGMEIAVGIKEADEDEEMRNPFLRRWGHKKKKKK